jgi:hypothetical protein
MCKGIVCGIAHVREAHTTSSITLKWRKGGSWNEKMTTTTTTFVVVVEREKERERDPPTGDEHFYCPSEC